MPSTSLPIERDFLKLSRIHTLVPVYRTVAADLETPVSAFLRIAAEEPEACLLESVAGGEHVGRYTFIGIEPYKKMISRGDQITVREGRKTFSFTGDIFAELKKALRIYTDAKGKGEPTINVQEAFAVLLEQLDVVRAMFHGFDYSRFETRALALLVPAAVVTTTGCVPVATVEGTWALSCVGLM